ncbi:RNA polymerase sigma factor [Amycolatopsis eburnea]|uniref:Sigma-70 family RNA polymerase sigma factor n=1 Tax=Amycolatopsis eburnea TaxID=2267691 RepID=A0A3R9EXP5_9PSEU|nr:sigma-70 family RNA polymerase sigma factor [Amycolatopsis eburnea]RSD07253.1 sigma-70 family RNA polymerase sigma factor [Amycolatopsis eburnea]
MDEPENRQRGWEPEDFARAFEKHWAKMVRAAGNASADKWAAEDAAAAAFAYLFEKRKEITPQDRTGWWCVATKYKLLDSWRKPHARREVPGDVVPEPGVCAIRASEIRSDTRELVDRILNLMDERRRRDVPLFLEVKLKHRTQADLAEELGIPVPKLEYRRGRAGQELREATTVALLTTAPGEGASRCERLSELSEGATDSPEFRRAVLAHLDDCVRCRRRAADREGLRSAIFVLGSGFALGTGLLRRLLTAPRFTTVSAAAGVGVTGAMVATLLLTPPTTGPVPERASPNPAIATTARPIATTPPLSTSPPPTTRPTPPLTVTPTPERPVSSRQDSAPTATGSSVQYRTIYASDSGTCGTKPTSSAVRVSVQPGAETAKLLLTFPLGGTTLPMWDTGGGTEWAGQVGPSYDEEDTPVTLHVAVELSGTGGRTRKDLGTIDVHPCRRGG